MSVPTAALPGTARNNARFTQFSGTRLNGKNDGSSIKRSAHRVAGNSTGHANTDRPGDILSGVNIGRILDSRYPEREEASPGEHQPGTPASTGFPLKDVLLNKLHLSPRDGLAGLLTCTTRELDVVSLN